MDSREERQRGSLSSSSEMRLSEGSIKTGSFCYEACRTLFVLLDEEKKNKKESIHGCFYLLSGSLQGRRVLVVGSE